MGQYNNKVYFEDETTLVVADGGKIRVDSGGEIETKSGSTVDVQSGSTVGLVRSVVRMMSEGMRAGAGAGWVLTGNTGVATLAASQSGATLVIPISGLKVGDIVTAFKLIGQIESAGQTVTVDADLRKLTAAAADPSDASLGAITQISKTADYQIVDSKTLGTAETLATGESLYVLVTATTGSSTDIQLMGVELTVTEA